MEIGYMDLYGMEREVHDMEKGIIPSQQVVLLKEAIMKTRKDKTLGEKLVASGRNWLHWGNLQP